MSIKQFSIAPVLLAFLISAKAVSSSATTDSMAVTTTATNESIVTANHIIGGISAPIEFDYRLDKDITQSDIRIHNILAVIKRNPQASLKIISPNNDGMSLANKLYHIFQQNHVNVRNVQNAHLQNSPT
jgi:hypothetical protein